MDKRWLKDRALSDHRCAGMTRFLQIDEQKRLKRLSNIKSTLSSSNTSKHNDFITKKYAERAKMLKLDRLKREKAQKAKVLKDFEVFVGDSISSGNLVTKSGLKTQEQHDMLPSSNNRRQYMGYITCNSKGNKVQDKGKCFEQSSCKLLSKHGQQIYEKHDNNSMLLTKET